MTITLELPPEIEASLVAQAQAHGLQLDAYLSSLLRRQAAAEHTEQRMNLEQFEAELDQLAQDSERLPYLPAEALRRESFYQDRD